MNELTYLVRGILECLLLKLNCNLNSIVRRHVVLHLSNLSKTRNSQQVCVNGMYGLPTFGKRWRLSAVWAVCSATLAQGFAVGSTESLRRSVAVLVWGLHLSLVHLVAECLEGPFGGRPCWRN